MKPADNNINAQGIEVTIKREDDKQWRLVQERIMPDGETKHDQLLNGYYPHYLSINL